MPRKRVVPSVSVPKAKSERMHLFEVTLVGREMEEIVAYGFDTRYNILTIWCQGQGELRIPRVYAPGVWGSIIERSS